jgi:hypothetical protein
MVARSRSAKWLGAEEPFRIGQLFEHDLFPKAGIYFPKIAL